MNNAVDVKWKIPILILAWIKSDNSRKETTWRENRRERYGNVNFALSRFEDDLNSLESQRKSLFIQRFRWPK